MNFQNACATILVCFMTLASCGDAPEPSEPARNILDRDCNIFDVNWAPGVMPLGLRHFEHPMYIELLLLPGGSIRWGPRTISSHELVQLLASLDGTGEVIVRASIPASTECEHARSLVELIDRHDGYHPEVRIIMDDQVTPETTTENTSS